MWNKCKMSNTDKNLIGYSLRTLTINVLKNLEC